MASRKYFLLLVLILSVTIVPANSCFSAIFSFGDSLADTGNLLISLDGKNRAGNLPYGETYFHRPTGRFSDGRLVVDFLAQAVGVPLLPPYLAASTRKEDIQQGVNFAVAEATALGNDFFREKGLRVNWTDYSLGIQIQWFKQMLPSLCSSKTDCKQILSNSLFLVGEIGGNDYNHPFFRQKTLEEVQTYVPFVIKSISSAISALIELGATILLVPGNFPIGCSSSYLTIFGSERTGDYDKETGCISWLNEFSRHHNHRLRGELDQLRRRHSHATIIYADYYEAAMNIFRSPHKFGFNKLALNACCGGGGSYNYNSSAVCGEEGYTVCDDPSRYISWDGVHLTEAAYQKVADGLLKGPYAVPSLFNVCSEKTAHILLQVLNPARKMGRDFNFV